MTITFTPGMKTSEFLVSILTVLGAIVTATQDYLTDPQAAGLSGLAVASYILSRGLAKLETRPPVVTAVPSTGEASVGGSAP